MRHQDEELQQKILDYINSSILEEDYVPNQRDIAKKMGISNATSQRYLSRMRDEGRLNYKRRDFETEATSKTLRMNAVPILGTIPCGEPTYEDQAYEGFTKLPEEIFGSGDVYLLNTTGMSMKDVGIEPGDYVVINRDKTPRKGDIIVALVDGANTLKRYEPNKRGVVLHPENEDYEDINVESYQDFQIQGVATHVIKEL